MGLTNEHVGSKILAKIQIYVLTRAELLFHLSYVCKQWYFFQKLICAALRRKCYNDREKVWGWRPRIFNLFENTSERKILEIFLSCYWRFLHPNLINNESENWNKSLGSRSLQKQVRKRMFQVSKYVVE